MCIEFNILTIILVFMLIVNVNKYLKTNIVVTGRPGHTSVVELPISNSEIVKIAGRRYSTTFWRTTAEHIPLQFTSNAIAAGKIL